MNTLVDMFSGIEFCFVGIRDYTNAHGEVSNYTVLIGANQDKAKQRDIAKLKLELAISDGIRQKACLELIQSLEKPNAVKSNAQIEAFDLITKHGVKTHKESGKIYIYGRKMSKVIKVKGTYPNTNKREMTIAKDELKEELELESYLYRQFIVDNISQIAVLGRILTADNGFEWGIKEDEILVGSVIAKYG